MTDLVVLVDFGLKAGQRTAFRRLVDANARASAAEPGCRRFDVLEPEGEPDRILLYEIYADRAALDAHLETAHYVAFDEASAALCDRKSVRTCTLVCEGGAS